MMLTRSSLQLGGFHDTAGYALDGEPTAWPIGPNESGDGYEYGDFYVNFATDAGTQSLPTPLVAVQPRAASSTRPLTISTATIAFTGRYMMISPSMSTAGSR